MSIGPQSIKEYWDDPKHNRRKSAGRRQSDYSVCTYHEGREEQDKKEKDHICKKFTSAKEEHEKDMANVWARLNSLEGRIVGRWAFGVMVTIFLTMFTIFGGINVHLFNSIKADLEKHIEMAEKGR